MRKLFTVLFAFAAIGVYAQVIPANTAGGSNSGAGEYTTAITALNTADAFLEDRLDSITVGDLTVYAADHVTITDNESTAENDPIVFVEAGDLNGGTLGLETDGDFYYTPSTGVLTATGFTIGSAAITEAELEILDGGTTTTDQLNYLNAATGTTGTTTTNLVFSTSPTLVTPALGTPSALVGTNITGTGASFTAGAVTGFTPASGSLTLAGADAVTLTTTASTNVTLPTTGTLVSSAVTDLLAPIDAPTFTNVVTLDSTLLLGAFGDATQTVLSEASSNTNPLVGIYPMVNFAASAGKVFAGAHSRMLLITTAQTNDASMFGMESQCRVKGVNLATGNHAGLWAYAEQSGTTVLSGGGTFDAIQATVESASTFTVGATEQVTGVTIDCSLDAGASVNASANFSGIYIKSNGLDWKTGIKITGVDSTDIEFQNGASISNEHADTLWITETAVSVHGALHVTGAITADGNCCADFATNDVQAPLLDYYATMRSERKLPSMIGRDRRDVMDYIGGVEEAAERNLRYIVELEARITELEGKLNE